MKRNTFIFIYLLVSTVIFANHPLVRNFTRKDYNSGTQNWAITQDENNIMYFANNNGLLTFDGKNWITVPINNGTNVRSLNYSGNGRFYASTFNEFGYFEKAKDGKLGFYSLTNKKGVNSATSNELFNIFQLNKNVYFQGDNSIFKYDGKTLKKISLKYKIDAAAVIHNTFMVASQQQGLFMLNGNLFVRIPGSEVLINKKVCSILALPENKVLIVTSFAGVYIYDGMSVQSYNTGMDEFLKSNQVFCATTNGKQVVYGTVQRGVAIQDLSNKSILYLNTFSGLQNNTILCAAFDNQENLWLGLDNGIDYVMLNSPVLNLFGSNNLYGSGYTSYLKNDLLYLGTNQGLYTTKFPFTKSPMPLQPELMKGMEGQVWSLNEIDNTLFCGNDKGAYIVHPNKVERIAGVGGTWTFKQLRQHPELILACSYQGLFILNKLNGIWKFSHFIKGRFNESSPMFEEDNDGNIWFSHWQKGVYHLQLNSTLDSITHVDLYDSSKGFPSDRNNTFFKIDNEIVFSSEKGFYKYNKKNDSMQRYEKWNNLFATTPSYIRLHESISGEVWCVSGNFIGLARKQKDNTYSMDSITYRILQSKLLVGFENFNFIDKNNLILNTEDGFSWIDTKRLVPTKNTFKVVLTSVIASNNGSTDSTNKHSFRNIHDVDKISHTNNSLRFDFNAPEYRNDGLVEYSYMLENYDNTWSDFTLENSKEYTKLGRGDYKFKIRARNLLEAKEATLTYSFTILPAWYESNLALIIYGIFLMLILAGIVLFVNYRSSRGAKEMERLKEIEINEQKKHFEADSSEKKKEIKELKNQQLQYELRHKSQELASSTMNLIRKNEILLEIVDSISKVSSELNSFPNAKSILSRLTKMEYKIKDNIENDNNWKKFEENFDLVYENYLKRLGENYPDLNTSDKKLCAYLKMDLSSKDIAPLLNMSVRSVETNRYRLRKKLNLEREVNLSEFLQKF